MWKHKLLWFSNTPHGALSMTFYLKLVCKEQQPAVRGHGNWERELKLQYLHAQLPKSDCSAVTCSSMQYPATELCAGHTNNEAVSGVPISMCRSWKLEYREKICSCTYQNVVRGLLFPSQSYLYFLCGVQWWRLPSCSIHMAGSRPQRATEGKKRKGHNPSNIRAGLHSSFSVTTIKEKNKQWLAGVLGSL